MDPRQHDSATFGPLPSTTLRNLSSSSSAFYSANQSPKSPTFRLSATLPSDHRKSKTESLPHQDDCNTHKVKKDRKVERLLETSVPPPPPFSSGRLRSCDVYIGFHGRKPLLLRFTNWLRAELEVQGLTCFATDRSRCRNSRKHIIVEKIMDMSMFGVVILTRRSFKNPYTIEELRYFSGKKNLVPIYFDLGPDDCLVRDIIERRGEVWDKYGGKLWLLYGGLEKEWRDAVSALLRADEWKLEARDGKWRDCILKAITLLALRLGKRSIVDRLSKWREKAEKEEFPFPRNENFVGRK